MKVKSSKVKSIALILIIVVVAWALFIPPIYSNYNVDFANKYLNRRFEEDQRIMKEFAAQGIKATVQNTDSMVTRIIVNFPETWDSKKKEETLLRIEDEILKSKLTGVNGRKLTLDNSKTDDHITNLIHSGVVYKDFGIFQSVTLLPVSAVLLNKSRWRIKSFYQFPYCYGVLCFLKSSPYFASNPDDDYRNYPSHFFDDLSQSKLPVRCVVYDFPPVYIKGLRIFKVSVGSEVWAGEGGTSTDNIVSDSRWIP